MFVGRDEAEIIWGTSTAAEIRELIDKPRYLIVKDADIQASEYEGVKLTECPPPRVQVVDSVGAGDAFAAGWLSGFLREESSEHRLRLGHYLASQALQNVSDLFNMPSLDSIESIIAKDPSDWTVADIAPADTTS